jgi:hypothetical protein
VREGDLTGQLFEALRAAVAAAIDTAVVAIRERPDFVVE